MHVPDRDRHTLCINGAKIHVFEQPNEVDFSRLLERSQSRRLKTKVVMKLSSDLAYQPLERDLADEELCRLLIESNFSQSLE